MIKSAVYEGNCIIAEAEIYPQDLDTCGWAREIRISHLSRSSGRCQPLAVMHTIATGGVCFKMESPPTADESPLFQIYTTCLRENKTAVVPRGEEELHLVAVSSRKNLMRYSYFWGFIIMPRLYDSCLVLLNLRCLGIVFDLDETLIVANTMRSFEDKVDAIQRKISNEVDPQRVTSMLAEIKRYQDDKSILKQYIESDQVVDNGQVFGVQPEIVPPLSDSHQLITRPIIRIEEKNIILTRVNPAIRDTSVLVRLRPAWEDLRSYLTARGRKRFEVYVCTMAERDYALEMWRLLDPEANLINSRELLDRIVCVKSGLRKSLLSVFQDGVCHPKMALVIDDRLKVWDEKDQSRVHVVPAFAPYYAPQAEANNSIPVLCVARNVACNVRGGFFKDFDESLLPRIKDVFYEDELINFPSAPDVGNYLVTEDDASATNGNKDTLGNEGTTDVEAERRLKDANCSFQVFPSMVNNFEPRPIPSLQHAMASSCAVSLTATPLMMPFPNSQCSLPIAPCGPLGPSGLSEPIRQGSPAREEGEVPESELDPDTRRRLLILQHGQDTRDPPPPPPPLPLPPSFSVRPPPLQTPVPPLQSQGSWLPLEEEINPRQLKRGPEEFPLEREAVRFDRNRSHHPSFFHGGDNFIPSDRSIHENQRFHTQLHHGDDWLPQNSAAPNYHSFPGEEMSTRQTSFNYRDGQSESGRVTAQYADTSSGVLQDIALKCGTKVEFRSSLHDSIDLRFSVETWLAGQKIGEGSGNIKKLVQEQVAESSLENLANRYLSNSIPDPPAVHGDSHKLLNPNGNGFISDSNSFGYPAFLKSDVLPIITSTSEESRLLDHKVEQSNKTAASVAALKELCIMEGYSLVFQAQPSSSMGSTGKEDVYAQVEIAGQILGKGSGITWEEAKFKAAEEALGTLKSMLGPFTQKRSGSPRSLPTTPSKRLKQDYHHVLQRIPSSGRYSKNETPVP